MNSVLLRALSLRFFAAVTAAFVLMPLASSAQTFFGSGGTTNSASPQPNLALGYDALYNTTTSSSSNIAIGFNSLFRNTSGSDNTAIGVDSMYYNSVGNYNTAIGTFALIYNITGNYNTASGYYALGCNTTGYSNTACGSLSLYNNDSGYWNTANGNYALYSNVAGLANTANGYEALYNATGTGSTANGYGALYSNTTGNYNTADGTEALYFNTTGSSNIALGFASGNGVTTGSNNIDIGNSGLSGDSGMVRIGTSGTQKATYIAGITGVTASGGVAVYINSNGQLGTLTSSRRFKNNITNMGGISDKLMKLRPVSFRYKDSAEKGPHSVQYGLIAEEVAKVYPNLVQYDKAGRPFTVYYHLLTPMLLNELQKTNRKYEAQRAEIAEMKADFKVQAAELASMKQAQQQQLIAIVKLNALAQSNRAPLQNVGYKTH